MENKPQERKETGLQAVQSTNLLQTSYTQTKVRTVEQAIAVNSNAISGIRKEHGENVVRAVVVLALCDLIDFFNVGVPMNDKQIAQTADLIIDRYYALKLEDLRVCFDRAKCGHYGQVYNRIDGAVIMEWLQRYFAERIQVAEEQSEHLHHRYQSPVRDESIQRRDGWTAETMKIYFEHNHKQQNDE